MAAFEEPLWPRSATPAPATRGATGASGERQLPPAPTGHEEGTHEEPELEPEPEAAPLDGPFFGDGDSDELPASPGAAPAAASFFAALAGRTGGLRQRAQRLVDKVNESRKADHAVMSDFRESLLLKVSALAEQLEERLFRLYDAHNGLIQERLRELAAAAERIARLQGELRRACRALEAAYRDLCLQPEP